MPSPTTGRLIWDKTGEHFYETGISKGVLYTGTVNSSSGIIVWNTGVAWNGLISVSESPEGADEEAFYADNIKYLSLRGVEDFGGSITCYQTPKEFDECDGTASLAEGGLLRIGQQSRKPFCLCYTTQIGNDVAGSDLGYEIHIIYNATASPSEREYQTINDSPEPNELSFDFTTTPIPVTGYKNTSIAKIRSTDFNTEELKAKLTLIENKLWGESQVQPQGGTQFISDPTLLTPDEILAIINAE